MTKRGIAILMSICMVALVGCGKTADQNAAGGNEDNQTVTDQTEGATGTEEGNIAGDAEGDNSAEAGDLESAEGNAALAEGLSEKLLERLTDGINIPDVTIEAKEIPENEALQFTADMSIGWNLGNTMDATVANTPANELDVETAWCGVETTQEMIDEIHAAGFNTLRLPVSWHNHVTGDDFAISEVWMNRVQEIVDYAYNQGMYVILNTHHDVDAAYYYPTSEYLESSTHYITSIWTQVAERFADYGDHLIFEGMNEPRMVGTNNEWWIDNNNAECQDAIACINTLNQAYVDTVRAQGSENNANRYLMVSGYDASIDGATNAGFVVPTDSADNKIIISVHAYTPYNFALQGPSDSGSQADFDETSTGSTRDIDSLFSKIYSQYISKGIPVVIGEFGARDKDNNLQARVNWAAYYIAAATANGVPCCWWDNNAFTGDGENFGLLGRNFLSWYSPEIVLAMMKYKM